MVTHKTAIKFSFWQFAGRRFVSFLCFFVINKTGIPRHAIGIEHVSIEQG